MTTDRSLLVHATGPLALVQDLGRPGFASLGVGPSGAADRSAHRLANRLVGNDESAATIEVLAGGLVIEAWCEVHVAVTGAAAAATIQGRHVEHATRLRLQRGQRLALGSPTHGLRSYVAVDGGVDVAPVLGSRSTDTLAGIGPAPLTAGAVLPVGPTPSGTADLDRRWGAGLAASAAPGPGEVQVKGTWGPRADWFDAGARSLLTASLWEVAADSDRIGVRLSGPVLERTQAGELPSEPVVRGSVQVPPSGQPVVFLADHPTTGGYPVIAVLDEPSLDALAQARPGASVRVAVLAPTVAGDVAPSAAASPNGR